MPFRFLSRRKAKKDADAASTSVTVQIDKEIKSMLAAFYLAAGASGAAMAGLSGAAFLDKDGRAAFDHCVRGGNVCAEAEMESVRRFESRAQWQLSASFLFMSFGPAAAFMRSGARSAARQAMRDEEKREQMWGLRMDLRKEQRENDRLQEELAALKSEIAPYRAQAAADAAKAARDAARKEEAARIAAATGLQQNIGISKPVTLKRK